jgi:hypothetical protein
MLEDTHCQIIEKDLLRFRRYARPTCKHLLYIGNQYMVQRRLEEYPI